MLEVTQNCIKNIPERKKETENMLNVLSNLELPFFSLTLLHFGPTWEGMFWLPGLKKDFSEIDNI